MSVSTVPGPSGTVAPESPAPTTPAASPRLRLWQPTCVLALFWAYNFAARHIEMLTFVRWIAGMGATLVAMLACLVWWLTNGPISRRHRFGALGAMAAGGVAGYFLYDKTLGIFTVLFFALPCAVTAGTIWLLVARGIRSTRSFVGLLAVLWATWGYFTLLRMEGISGEQQAAIHWRWTPTAEELYLAEKKGQEPPATGNQVSGDEAGEPLVAHPGDWTGFRGPERDATVRGVQIATDWNAAPPKQIWRQRVGPAWSSVAVIGDRLFTQEQRGESEAVVCLDAETGRELWVHEDHARFWEGVAGAGPRATPTFAAGRLYSAGATGLLNCLDAKTGKRSWSRDFSKESGAKVPLWGFSSSPLVVGDLVVIFAGGEGDMGLLAYRAETGEPAWQVAAGHNSYSSPHLASIDGREQILCLSDAGLTSVEPESGNVLWNYGGAAPGAPISIQPHPLGESQVLIPSVEDVGLALLEVKHEGASWSAEKLWPSRSLQPSFNDFVIHDGAAYGFDEAIFGCFDIATGKRLWKGGRYGHGQVLLVADQGLLVVIAESGEAVLLKANPKMHEELCRFPAIEGKTWNHPALVRGRLYVRNAEEMACYDIGAK